MEHFFIFHKNGVCVFKKSFVDRELDSDIALAFSSALVTLPRTTAAVSGPQKTILVVESKRWMLIDLGEFRFLSRCHETFHEDLQHLSMTSVEKVLTFFFGDSVKWDRSSLHLHGFHDILSHTLKAHDTDLSSLTDGYNQVFLERSTKDQLDHMLATVEEQEGVTGAILMLKKSVLHSRLKPSETRMISTLVAVRPLGVWKLRLIPVFNGTSWENLLLHKVHDFVLGIIMKIGIFSNGLKTFLVNLEQSIGRDQLSLPTEEPPVQLRQFAGSETVGFLYHHVRSGLTLYPVQRGITSSESKGLHQTFLWALSKARGVLSKSDVSYVIFNFEKYLFHAQVDETRSIYVLYTTHVSDGAVQKSTREIVRQIELKAGFSSIAADPWY